MAGLPSPLASVQEAYDIAERHIGAGVKLVMGATKDPAMAIFRRLREEWRDLSINYSELPPQHCRRQQPMC